MIGGLQETTMRGEVMLSRRTKKIASRCMRDMCKHRRDINHNSIMEDWHTVRDPFDSDSWRKYTLLECDSLEDAISSCEEVMLDSRARLPEYDCSGMAFMYDYHVGKTNMPNVYAIVTYWTVDV